MPKTKEKQAKADAKLQDQQEAAAAGEETHAQSYAVLVRGVPDGTFPNRLRHLFQVPADTKVKIKPGGTALVFFPNLSEAKAACEIQDAELDGVAVKVSLPKGQGKSVGPRVPRGPREEVVVIADALPKGVDEQEIRQTLREFGSIGSVELKRGGSVAHVGFLSAAGARQAVAAGMKAGGKTIALRLKAEPASDTFITIHFKSVPAGTTQEQIEAELKPFGHVRGVRVVSHTHGFMAFADLETKTAARKACKSGISIKGKKIKAKLSKSGAIVAPETKEKREVPPDQRSDTTVFVKNLPYTMETSAIKRIFKAAGRVNDVRPFLDKTTSTFKGMAYVDLEGPQAVKRAVGLNDTVVEGRALKVDYCISRDVAVQAKRQRREEDEGGNKRARSEW